MSNQSLLDDLLVDEGGNIVLSKKSPEYTKNRLLMFLSLVFFYLLGLLIKGITSTPKSILIHYRFQAVQEIVFDKIISLKEAEDNIILETNNGKTVLPLFPFYDLVPALKSFYLES